MILTVSTFSSEAGGGEHGPSFSTNGVTNYNYFVKRPSPTQRLFVGRRRIS